MVFWKVQVAWRLRLPKVFSIGGGDMARKASDYGDDEKPKKTMYTITLTDEQMEKLGGTLDARGWFPHEVQYARFAFKGEQINVVGYTSGKLVIQGKKTEDFVQNVLEPEITGEFLLGYEEVNNPEWFEHHAGLDESGKGDLFGPVVTACVIADGDMVRKWMDGGIRDSKTITDSVIVKMHKLIVGTKGVVIKTAYTGMPKYNELYQKFGQNLNKLLAWLHGRALNDALEVSKPTWGLLDQFSKQPLVQRQVEDKSFDLRMRPKAEEDPVVAAASVVARATWLQQMRKLEKECGEPLPKGSGANAKEKAQAIVARLGPDSLNRFCKLHFKTAYEALGKTPPAKKKWNPNWGRGKKGD